MEGTMSHEIEILSDGAGSFYSARETPWHRLGVVMPEAVGPDEALRLARADYEVFKSPVRYAAGAELVGMTEDGKPIEQTRWVDQEGNYTTWRTHPETGLPVALGKGLGDDYTVVQNTEAVEFMQALMDVSGAPIETAGVLYDGRQFFASMKMPEGVQVGGVDPVDTYMIVSKGHDGRRALTVDISHVRVVCKNTLDWAQGQALSSVKIRHTKNAVANLEDARRALDVTFANQDAFAHEANELLIQRFTTAEFETLIAQVWPVRENTTNKRTLAAVEARTEHLFRLWTDANTQEAGRQTKWAALNAIVEYADWYTPMKSEDGQGRALRIVDKALVVAQPKRKALALLSS